MPTLDSSRIALALTLALAGACAGARAEAPLPAGARESARTLPARGGPLSPTAPAEPAIRTSARMTIGAVGDVLMHEAVKRSAETYGKGSPDGGYSWLYAQIADLLSEPTVTFANLETPIGSSAANGTREFVFNAPPEAALALRDAGIDVVSVANNHSFDQGRSGFEETLRSVAAAGLTAVGAGAEGHASGPARVEAGGLSVAFLAWAQFFNQGGNACPAAKAGAPPCVQAAQLDPERAVADVRAAAASFDAVVVSVHWGVEYEPQPRAAEVDLAHRLADAGALVVLGHHPHVLQPIELYRRADGRTAVIAYSLGNLVSNQSRKFVYGITPERVGATRDGVLLRVALAKRDYGRGVVRIEVDGVDFVPLWTDNDTAEMDRAKKPSRPPAIRVVAVDRALASVRAEMARFPDPVPTELQGRWAELRRREALLASRRAAAAAILGEELLRPLDREAAVPAAAGGAPREGAPATPDATPSARP